MQEEDSRSENPDDIGDIPESEEPDPDELAQLRVQLQETQSKAQEHLEILLPVLTEAQQEIETIERRFVQELMSFVRPPELLETVLGSVYFLLQSQRPRNWREIVRMTNTHNFLSQLRNFDRDSLTEAVVEQVKKRLKEVKKDDVARVSLLASRLLVWVRAMLTYFEGLRIVNPLRRRVESLASQIQRLRSRQQQEED